MAGRDVLPRTDGAQSRLLCFPISRPVAMEQSAPILAVQTLDRSDRYDHMMGYLREHGDLADISQRELTQIGPDIVMQRHRATDRRETLFAREDFLFGVYAMSRLLIVQAEENMAMGDEGTFPSVTHASHQAVLEKRFEDAVQRGQDCHRDRFEREIHTITTRETFLAEILHAIAVRSEMQGARATDFYGGAAFAYQLFQHAA